MVVVGSFVGYLLCNLFPIFWEFLNRFWFCKKPPKQLKSEYEGTSSVATANTYEDLEMNHLDRNSTIVDIEKPANPDQIDVFDEVIEQAGRKVKQVLEQGDPNGYVNAVKHLKQAPEPGTCLYMNGKLYSLSKLNQNQGK